MKIFVTGATGYIGRHLVKKLVNNGHEVTAFIRKSSRAELMSLGVSCVNGDITDLQSLQKAMQEAYDAVYHLAASVVPISDERINLTAAENLVKVLKNKNIKKFIYVSTSLVYGNTQKSVSEDYACKPETRYGNQALQIEGIFLEAFRKFQLPVVILRPSLVFGGEGGYFGTEYLSGLISGKIPVIGNGENYRTMTYYGDLVQALLTSLRTENIEGEIFNINTPDTVSTNDLTAYIAKNAGVKPPVHIPFFFAGFLAAIFSLISTIFRSKPLLNGEIVNIATLNSGEIDISKARHKLGFIPKYEMIFQGIRDNYFS